MAKLLDHDLIILFSFSQWSRQEWFCTDVHRNECRGTEGQDSLPSATATGQDLGGQWQRGKLPKIKVHHCH